MKRTTFKKKALCVVMAALISFAGILPAGTVFAANEDGVDVDDVIELFYKDSDTIVPQFQDDNETEYIEYMKEGDELALTYKLMDYQMPDNGRINWYSETPTLVDVTQEGVVKAFDSSKGAVVQTWIDNEVKTIPLVGSAIASVIEKALFNEYIDINTMDAEAIVDVVEGLFGSDSLLDKYIESYKGELVDSLREYLNRVNTKIFVQLFDAEGNLIDEDSVQICVEKSEEWYAAFLPNGTHITNKSQINTTVAVGSTTQLYAVTTPLRLNYGVVYSVKSSSIFDQGKVVATVDDSGLVTFKNTGTVTIMVSPDTEAIIEGILKLVNYFYALDNTGTIDSDQIADILIKYVGLDINRTVLAGILDVCFAISDIVGDAADPVQLTATAVEIISNLVLQFAYNDSITFTVVEAQPIDDFTIEGANTVKEGSQIQLSITNVQPETGDTSDITWTSSDPSIASVDPNTGVITGRDAGGSLGVLSTQQCTIYATSAANNVTKSYTITVTGKTGRYLSDVEIQGDNYLEIGEETDFTYTVFPKRVAESDNLYITWGIQNGTDEEGNPTYLWASADAPADNGIGRIDSKGHYTVVAGGNCIIAVKATTGYYLTNDNFYEISSYIGTMDVSNGIPVESIKISVTNAVGSLGEIKHSNTVALGGEELTYVTVKAKAQYNGVGASISAAISPGNASNQTLRWVIEGGDFDSEISSDTHTATVKKPEAKEYADTFNIYAVTEDGRVRSNAITVCVTKNYVTSNVIDQNSIEITNGKTADATHSISIDGSDISYAASKKCNWYSSDESVFTVTAKDNDNCDATLTAVDVGTATLYCVSADGGITDECTVTVYPDKERLRNIVELCDKTIVKRTDENKELYTDYMRQLDLAYYVLYDEPMAAQTSCDTYADELLYAFYKVGGFVGISGVTVLDSNKNPLESKHITVSVGTLDDYTDFSYDLDYSIKPVTAMYSDVEWSSSNPGISVDKNGVCRPSSDDPASAVITCTVTDYMGGKQSDSVFVTFAHNQATGVTLDTYSISGGKIGETKQITATVSPTPVGIVGGADCTDVYWSSSDESIATVNQNGVVTFVEGGNCIIYCTTYDGGHTAQCTVNVITNYSALELLVKQYTDLSLNEANYFPDSWSVYCDAMDKARAMLAQGSDYSQDEVDAMTAELENAYKSLEKYNYIQNVELYLDGEQTKEFYQYDLSLLKEGISYKNAILNLNVRLYPNNGSYASVKWESSTTDISVTGDGQCSPTINDSCYGMITCTVTDHFGNEFKDSVWVSFSYYPVTALELSDTSITLDAENNTHTIGVTVQPTGSSLWHIGAASIQDYFWESDNEDIATVDSNGTVTFVSAGSTIVRAVSYDGGIYAECVVSCDGDRSALLKALEDYKDTDYTQYAYEYGTAFKQAYDNAQSVMNSDSVSQQDIDNAADTLNSAYQQMIEHPFIKAESIGITYATYKDPLIGSTSQVSSGSIGGNDALSVNLSDDGYSALNYYNYIDLSAAASPADAMYSSIVWSVNSSEHMEISINGAAVKLTPKDIGNGAMANLTVTLTDQYNRTMTRTITVVMADSVLNGFDITDADKTMYATQGAEKLNYTVSGDSEFSSILWSSSNEAVAKVDDQGNVTPVDKGEATITGKTVDGGFTDSIKVTVLTDFSVLAQKYDDYYKLIEDVKDSYTYTQESLDVLSKAVSDAKIMIDDGKATQAEVNNLITNLDNAYNSLVEYVATTGVDIGYEEADGVSSVNPGYIRYTSTVLLNGKNISLTATPTPANSVYSTMTWSSSNPDITVDEYGVVTNHSASAGVTKITCTVTNVFGGEYSSSVYVSFTRSGVTGISFDDEMVYGAPGQTVTLSPNIENTNNSTLATTVVKDCIYKSDNEDVATVDDSGVVTFNTQGEAVITATSLDGGFTATIKAYTTWDTTALIGALETAKDIDYTDYAYDYGMAFKTAYENAQAVYDNIYASQAEIDLACSELTEATNALAGNEFILPEVTVSQNGEALENESYIETDAENNAVIDIALNEGAMVKSTVITPSEENGVTVSVDGSQATITKTADTGSFTLTVTTVDDYDRETVTTYIFNVIATPIPATSIALTADGEPVTDGTIVRSCGGTYTNFNGITLGYVPTPENANSITGVTYSSSAELYITVDENGKIELTNLGKIRSSNTATITCEVTNLDGTKVSAEVMVTISRR